MIYEKLTPVQWAARIPIKGKAKKLLLKLALVVDIFGRGTICKAQLAYEGFDSAFKYLVNKRVIISYQCEDSNVYHYQLRLQISPMIFRYSEVRGAYGKDKNS